MIKVIDAGFFTTIQDKGRWGYQSFGMSVAGAMDRYAYRVANILAGNLPNAAVFEMTLKGDTFRFEQDSFVAVCGADMQGTLNGQAIANWSSFVVPAGSELAFGYALNGCRTYLAVHGGTNVPEFLGSRATYVRAGVGGHEGRKLRPGDVLPIGGEFWLAGESCVLPEIYRQSYGTNITLRVLPGPQDDLFTEEGLMTLFNSCYQVSNEADRMGYRLEGPVIQHSGKPDIISDALCQGAIQVPGHGMPIIMMADRQTTGGYTKIGAVIGPDLMLLAQAKPGDTITFQQSTDEEAAKAWCAEMDRYTEIEDWRQTLLVPCKSVAKHFRVTVNGQPYSVEISEV